MKKLKKILIILFFISLLTRLYFLFFGIKSITNDEADYYLSSYLLSKTGTDQFGHAVFFSTGFLNGISSVPVYIGAIFWKLIPIKNVFFARLPFALLNSITPVLFFLITYYFSKNLLFSIISYLIMNFSPWFSHLSATAAFDSPLSLLFFLAAFVSLYYVKKSKWLRNILFILFNFLAFNSYMGFKTIFLPLLIFFLLLFTLENYGILAKKKIFIILALSTLIFSVFFTISVKGPGGNLFSSRAAKTIVFFDKVGIDGDIWYANLTTNNRVVRKIFNNYIFASTQKFLSKYTNAYNPAIYFFAEPHVIYGLRILGLFFVTDCVFFIIGIFFGLQKLRKTLKYLILGLLIIAPIPVALQVEGITVALRGIFLLPAFSLIIASGYYFLIRKFNNRYFYILLIALFIANTVSFLSLYQYRIKVISSESWSSTKEKILSDLNGDKRNVYMYISNDEKMSFFMMHAIYNPISNIQYLKKQLVHNNTSKYVDGNFIISASCQDILTNYNKGIYLIDVKNCPTEYEGLGKDIKKIKEYYSEDKTGELLYVRYERI